MPIDFDKLPVISPWPAGANNVAREDNLPREAVRSAVNVNFEDGRPERRPGYTTTVEAGNVHSVWADYPAFPYMLAVIAGTLVRFDTDMNQSTVQTGLHPDLPLSYCEVNGAAYWSNSQTSGMVGNDGTAAPLGIDGPAGQPLAAAVANQGGLQAGNYQVTVTFVTAAGLESGAPLAVTVNVAEGGGIRLTAIPQPTDSRVTAVRVYATGRDGDVLYWRRNVPVGLTTVVIGHLPPGKPLETQWLEPMPPGQLVAYFNGMLWVASGRTLWHSDPLRYGMANLATNYIGFADEITMLAPAGQGHDGAGLWVAAGQRTFWLAGAKPGEMEPLTRYPFGAVPGSQTMIPYSQWGIQAQGQGPYWMATNGVACIGAPGQIVPLTEDRYVAPNGDRGASVLMEVDGQRRVITTLNAQRGSGFAAADVATAAVYRNGIEVISHGE